MSGAQEKWKKSMIFSISYFGYKCLKRLIRRQNYYTKLLKLVSISKKVLCFWRFSDFSYYSSLERKGTDFF